MASKTPEWLIDIEPLADEPEAPATPGEQGLQIPEETEQGLREDIRFGRKHMPVAAAKAEAPAVAQEAPVSVAEPKVARERTPAAKPKPPVVQKQTPAVKPEPPVVQRQTPVVKPEPPAPARRHRLGEATPPPDAPEPCEQAPAQPQVAQQRTHALKPKPQVAQERTQAAKPKPQVAQEQTHALKPKPQVAQERTQAARPKPPAPALRHRLGEERPSADGLEPREQAPAQPQGNQAGLEGLMEELRAKQNLTMGAVGGLLAVVVGALVWAAITIGTGWQVGWMAIGVGFLVGSAVRVLGHGVDKSFGYLGAGLSLVGCLLGNLVTIYAMVGAEAGVPAVAVLGHVNLAAIPGLMVAAFHPLDLLFYAIAVYEGYRFAFRKMTEADVARLVRGD